MFLLYAVITYASARCPRSLQSLKTFSMPVLLFDSFFLAREKNNQDLIAKDVEKLSTHLEALESIPFFPLDSSRRSPLLVLIEGIEAHTVLFGEN